MSLSNLLWVDEILPSSFSSVTLTSSSKLLPSRDICPILKDPSALTAVTDLFEEHVRKNHQHVDVIAGIVH